MNTWKLLVTRETPLLERWIRIKAYQSMFGSLSKIRLRNLLTINNHGVSGIYLDKKEEDLHRSIVLSDCRSGRLSTLVIAWNRILADLERATRRMELAPSESRFRAFVRHYQKGRAIVYYSRVAGSILEKLHDQEGVEKMGFWHEKAETETSYAWDRVAVWFVSLARTAKQPLGSIMYYTPQELTKLLAHGVVVPTKEIRERKESFLLHLDDGTLRLYQGRDARSVMRRYVEQKKTPEFLRDSFNGAVAYSGVATGRVRVVNTVAQARRMKEGDILVSIMTTPRLVPAVKKAAAVVTDEGGITCHAAIICRELNIPCIVGTHIATQALKNGDHVEVDAIRGVVKKINKT